MHASGELITAHQAENGVYIWEITNPLYFKMHRVEDILFTGTRVYHIQIRFNHNLRRALGLHKAFLNFQVWTTSMRASGTTYSSWSRHVSHAVLTTMRCILRFIMSSEAVRFRNRTDRMSLMYSEDHSIKFKIY
ncbi:replication enhancer protein [Sidastrum golden leaf spot virus]|uniref:Replication enhancer n=1 Tax=Sidastrum golden leaf spot virus TaxID=858513 RepID=E2GI61_9GEMI|nr:replication enhancer protein [Sidastrum golden leaf spot virus]ADK55010.2 replication enhancer protein [Sidastrum golden leaf spot virus]